jgi:hypothetical protein
VRLSVRRQGHHIALALNVPDPQGLEPSLLAARVKQLAECLARG